MKNSWTFQKRVQAGFGVMVSLAIVTAIVAVYALQTVVASKDVVVSLHAQGLIDTARLQAASDREAAGFLRLLASPKAEAF